MLVVPDNATANKFLSVPGMIVYREDKKKLYVAKDKKLNALAEEKKVPVNQVYTSAITNCASKLHCWCGIHSRHRSMNNY